MEKYLWLFPVLFIFHDMEEIIGFKMWLNNNKDLFDNKLKILKKLSNNYSTEGMAVAVFEELSLCIAVSIISLITNWYGIWLGLFIAYTIHLVIHMCQAIIIRKYIPALITSIICLMPSIYIIKKCIDILAYKSSYIVLLSFIGLGIVLINLKFAHFLLHKFTLWMEKEQQ